MNWMCTPFLHIKTAVLKHAYTDVRALEKIETAVPEAVYLYLGITAPGHITLVEVALLMCHSALCVPKRLYLDVFAGMHNKSAVPGCTRTCLSLGRVKLCLNT